MLLLYVTHKVDGSRRSKQMFPWQISMSQTQLNVTYTILGMY